MCLLSRAKPIAQEVAIWLSWLRAIWIGHRFHDRRRMALSLKAGTYTGHEDEGRKLGQGIEAWEWVEAKSGRPQAVDVALYSIQGLPNACKKKAGSQTRCMPMILLVVYMNSYTAGAAARRGQLRWH